MRANARLSCPGVKLHGAGFIVTPERADELGLGTSPELGQHIREYRNGRDLTQRLRGVMVIDLFGLESSDVRRRFPAVYQHLRETVYHEREAKRGRTKDADKYADDWWLFGKVRGQLRESLRELPRYIATVETTKHRTFQFLDRSILPDTCW